MRRRDFISIIGTTAATGLFATRLQAEPVRRIGVLMGMDAGDPVGRAEVKAFEQGLQELGWIEGRNLRIEHSWEPVDDRH
jgi:putative ABC transport system substrate-binding protein